MIRKYYSGIIVQEFHKIGKQEKNIVLAKYNNDFSLKEFEFPNEVKNQNGVFLAIHQFGYKETLGPFEPFLDLICDIFRAYGNGDFGSFLDANNVYYLHRELFVSYYDSGMCHRKENMIQPEVEFEKQRILEEMVGLLIAVSKLHPFMLVLNRLQIAPMSTIRLIVKLFKAEDTGNMAIVLSMNDASTIPHYMTAVWEEMIETLEDASRIIHIGRGSSKQGDSENILSVQNSKNEEVIKKITNLLCMMDFGQALYYLEQLDRKIKFENMDVDNKYSFAVYRLYAMTCIFVRDLAKTLEICEEFKKLGNKKNKLDAEYTYHYILASANMYQGRLPDALVHARECQKLTEGNNDELYFQSRLIEVQIKMSGWCNIFFCSQDVEVEEDLLEELVDRDYLNHLAYIYIYAYDNEAELLKKAAYEEDSLVYFSKGIELARTIGNYHLLYIAYQKNIMLASTNGMNDIAMLYSVRTFETLQNKNTQECGRIYSGIGYNLSAMGFYKEAEKYYNRSIELFYQLKLPEDIAEVFYNVALNCFAMAKYREAEEYLMQCMKAIEKLKLNSLRVCNISKLYGILALTNAVQGNHFNCERYLHSCKQFLNYFFEKEHADNQIGIKHDYANCDDDMFLYHFAKALLAEMNQDAGEAYECYMAAERYLAAAEGNAFYCNRLFRKSRITFFEVTGRSRQREQERQLLETFEEMLHGYAKDDFLKILSTVDIDNYDRTKSSVTHEEIDGLLKQEGINRAHQSMRRQLDFLSVWQKMINNVNITPTEMLDMVMKSFQSHFSVDCSFYVRYFPRKAEVLYNDTGCSISDEKIRFIASVFEKDQRGFAVSKISSDYSEHLNIISMFGEDDVCSMVAVPFLNNGRVESVLITYILMKENWHSSVNRYMLDDDDLMIYELLFREVSYALKRIDNARQIYEMNKKLYQSAITDQLTGVYNRKGLYQRIDKMFGELSGGKQHRMSIMFIDLDNFKYYNDYFGHDIGDLILKGMADIFKKIVTGKGYVFRYGGDEFILMVKTDNQNVLREMAEKVYDEIRLAEGFVPQIVKELGHEPGADAPENISCSIGIATACDARSHEDVLNMMKQADAMLYQIKENVKGTYKFI